MPVTYSIDPARRIVRLRIEGVVQLKETRDAITAALRDPSYQKGFGFLSDRRSAPPVNTGYAQELGTFLASIAELAGVRWAVVVRDDAGFGMARAAQTYISLREAAIDVKIFREIAPAEEWLSERC